MMRRFARRQFSQMTDKAATPTTIYDFKLKTLKGKDFDTELIKGKVVLIVNTASNF